MILGKQMFAVLENSQKAKFMHADMTISPAKFLLSVQIQERRGIILILKIEY